MNQSIDDRMNPNPGRVKNKGCESCKTIKFCMNSWLDKNAVDAVERIMKRKVFSAGRKIYRRGNPSQSFYVVQSGTVKVERILGDGRHYVHGFYHIVGMYSASNHFVIKAIAMMQPHLMIRRFVRSNVANLSCSVQQIHKYKR
ncbi:hypothetical protein BOW50_11265 [Solemya velum gill symbiont]|uniref:cyclic nucleotide-binding domain-containing protein n=1 Tax=Solemya velum gill symbiont TaxID=2340 RepID=UPI0009973CEC|nr:hypothetical protein BOW50_11265 [Solemya velum gill symbiont]